MEIDKLAGKSNTAVVRATGKSWSEWVNILDAAGLRDAPHKRIVQWLWDNGYAGIDVQPLSGWWAQTVAVGYEYYHGRRQTGQTSDAGYEVGAQKTVAVARERVWEFLVSDTGLELWLGNGVAGFRPEKGVAYELSDGTKGQVRSCSPGEKLRLTWESAEHGTPTTLQISLEHSPGVDTKTVIRFHQEKLTGTKERETMKQHWRSVLEGIAEKLHTTPR